VLQGMELARLNGGPAPISYDIRSQMETACPLIDEMSANPSSSPSNVRFPLARTQPVPTIGVVHCPVPWIALPAASKKVGPAIANVREKPVSSRVHVTNSLPPANPLVGFPAASTNVMLWVLPRTVAVIGNEQTSGNGITATNGPPWEMIG